MLADLVKRKQKKVAKGTNEHGHVLFFFFFDCQQYRTFSFFVFNSSSVPIRDPSAMKHCAENYWLVPCCRSTHLGAQEYLKVFTAKGIRKATEGFSVVLGSGNNGTTYRARLPDGHVVNVRKARASRDNNTFIREVQLIGQLHHRHLVRLRGFSKGRDRFLVFEHYGNGSLKEYLHDPLRTPLNWRTRLRIAVDIASALEYLNCFCDPPVYSVSISSNNVLLDENFVAKLADVGLLDSDKDLFQGSNTRSSQDHFDLRSKNLTFQFGMLILELVTGQSISGQDGELIQWIQDSGFTYTMYKMVDTDLGGEYNPKELRSLLIVARLCIMARDEQTVSISQILRYLQGKIESF